MSGICQQPLTRLLLRAHLFHEKIWLQKAVCEPDGMLSARSFAHMPLQPSKAPAHQIQAVEK